MQQIEIITNMTTAMLFFYWKKDSLFSYLILKWLFLVTRIFLASL
jgi:hypothetical protein